MRKILLLLIALILVGCQVAEIPVTVIVTPEQPTAEPTPTQENQDWIDSEPFNPNWWMMDGCSMLVFGDRQFCLPYGWTINEDVFDQDEERPAPDATVIQGDSHDQSYLEMRIDYLTYEMCLVQSRQYLDESDDRGELNYVFKIVTNLVIQGDYDEVQRPLLSFSIGDLSNPENSWSSPVSQALKPGKQTFLWVVAPTKDYENGVSYKWCFDYNGMPDANLRVIEASAIRAGRAWGSDIAGAFSAEAPIFVEAKEF